MSTMLRDLMLVCRNGHVITDRLRARPDLRSPKCDLCGAGTIDRCDTCGHLLAGANPVLGLEPMATARVPPVCATCGTVFPWERESEPFDDTAMQRLENLLRRVPRVARELGQRQAAPLFIHDDGDLEDLVRAVLPIHFDEVRIELRLPSYSAGNRRAFYVPEMQTMVMPHLIRQSMGEPEMASRCREDLEGIRSRSEVATLVEFILDPELRLRETRRLEAAWSQTQGRLEVRCVIA